MKISDKCVNMISEFEGIATAAYRCPAGVWTIGIGETETFALTGQKIGEGLKVTEQQVRDSFKVAIAKYENAVNSLGVTFNQNQFDALTSFCYNLGTGIFTGSLLAAIKSKDWNSVADQLKLYNKARVDGVLTVLPGLTRRRNEEAELFLTSVIEDDPDLMSAVSKIIKSGGIDISFNSWKRKDLININNVPALLKKLSGWDKVVSDVDIWDKGTYTVSNVRSLLIKYAMTIS